MIDVIALPVVLVIGMAGFSFVRRNGRGGRESWHLLRGLGPVSGEWLADYRRIG
jgi:hypothetical protein